MVTACFSRHGGKMLDYTVQLAGMASIMPHLHLPDISEGGEFSESKSYDIPSLSQSANSSFT